ncbi:MAG: hypothetical protein H0U46_05680 [Actinobacteria bacterium]|nr:hypothetical protein [Actinomycetota bacterium]
MDSRTHETGTESHSATSAAVSRRRFRVGAGALAVLPTLEPARKRKREPLWGLLTLLSEFGQFGTENLLATVELGEALLELKELGPAIAPAGHEPGEHALLDPR